MTAIARDAGAALMAAYRRADLQVAQKADASPVTNADKASHELILARLSALPGHWPVLSEEGDIPDWAERRNWTRYWLVDPLDGTQEFIDGTGDFAVHIALIDEGRARWGVVYQPARDQVWAGEPGAAWRQQADSDWQPLRTRVVPDELTVLASRYRPGQQWPQLLENLGRHTALREQRLGGSAKYCRIAAGEADLYPCLVPVSEWDSAAPQAVLEGAGGVGRNAAHQPLRYNTKENLRQQPFYAAGDPDWAWSRYLQLP